MQQAKRVLWGEGMFLRPQHFQQQALLLEQHLSSRQQLSNRHAWGVQQITLDEQALKGGTVRIDALSILFRDGTLYQAPVNAPLPLSRDLNTLPQAGIKTTLYACLAHMQPYGGNTRSGEAMSRPTRFQSANVEVADLYTQALDADLSTLELDVRLMIEEENRDGYDAIPLCRLEKDATGQWSLAGGFIPPLVTVEGSHEVSHMLRRLLDILLVKNQALSGGQRERAKNVMEYSSSDISSFWLLHTVNRNFAKLRHLSLASPLHPEELYLALAEFCGELQTFSTHYTLSDIPAYRHDDLHTVLPALDAQIRELLETVISSRYAIIPLHSPAVLLHRPAGKRPPAGKRRLLPVGAKRTAGQPDHRQRAVEDEDRRAGRRGKNPQLRHARRGAQPRGANPVRHSSAGGQPLFRVGAAQRNLQPHAAIAQHLHLHAANALQPDA